MATVTAGQTWTDVRGALEGFRVDCPQNCSGTISFVPLDPFTGEATGSLSEQGNSRRFGPHAEKFTFGPMGRYGRFTLVSDSRSTGIIDITGATTTLGSLTNVGATTITGALTFTSANVSANFSPTGTGTVTINPATAGTINNMQIGLTGPGFAKFNAFALWLTSDTSGTPGPATINGPRGRMAIAAGSSSVVLTNSQFSSPLASCFVFISQGTADATLTRIERVSVTTSSATIYGNAVATGNVVIDWIAVA